MALLRFVVFTAAEQFSDAIKPYCKRDATVNEIEGIFREIMANNAPSAEEQDMAVSFKHTRYLCRYVLLDVLVAQTHVDNDKTHDFR